ncbi:MAG: hypothetical protein ABWZ75_13075 [Novosphingobium sp.]
MTKALGLLSILAATAAGAADPATGVATSAVADLVDVTNSVCYPHATGELPFTATPKTDKQILAAKKLTAGITGETKERLGRAGFTFLSGSIMAQRPSGADMIVLGVEGDMPGCKTILVSASTDSVTDAAAAAFTASSLGWKEAPSTNQPGAPLQKRMFVRRDGKGVPYVLNLTTTAIPNSQIRVFTTVNPIPDSVQLPEGF